jgi:multiple sugar transport system permease protein
MIHARDGVQPPIHRGLSDRRLALLLILPAAVLLLIFAVYPFIVAAADSFFRVDFLSGARTFVGLGNYLQVVSDPEIRAAFVRSFVWTVFNVAIQGTLGVGIALLLNAQLFGQTLARGLVLFPYVVPAIVTALVFEFMFNDVIGLVNYLLVAAHAVRVPISFLSDPKTVLWTLIAVNCWKYTPFIVIVVLARLQVVPLELYDAAAIDGAGRWSSFRQVTLPWIMPVLIVACLVRTIWTAYEFDLPYLLAFGGPLGASTTVPIEIRALAFGRQEIGAASALAACAAILLAAGAYWYLRAYRRSEHRME